MDDERKSCAMCRYGSKFVYHSIGVCWGCKYYHRTARECRRGIGVKIKKKPDDYCEHYTYRVAEGIWCKKKKTLIASDALSIARWCDDYV
jgi:hypothetical protein